MLQVGQTIRDKYRVLRLVGDGGMGSVYEAEHLLLGTRVALKTLHPELTKRPGLVDRFLQEARVAAQIRDPHVVQVLDVDNHEGIAYIVMELLEGEPLSDVLNREHRLGVDRASDYARQILLALEAAHALGVTHRDLKPENVFVTTARDPAADADGPPAPLVKLIDFGIAKLRHADPSAKNLTVAGVMMGTAEYMAPEQAYSADRVDARADIYAAGVMLYEMLAGMRPVNGEDARVIVLKVERGEVTPLVHACPGVQPELAGLVHRAMAAKAELRFESARAMRAALEAATHKRKGITVGPGAASPTGVLGTGVPVALPGPGALPAAGAGTDVAPPVFRGRPTGTQMGAPLPAAATFGPGPAAFGPAAQTPQAGPRTQMGAPSPMAQAPMPGYGGNGPGPMAPPAGYPSPGYPSHGGPSAAPPRQAKRGFPLWLVIVPAILGGGVGVAAVLGYLPSDGADPAPTVTATTSPTAAPPKEPASSSGAIPSAGPTVAPFLPGGGTVAPPLPGTPGTAPPRPSATVAADAGAPAVPATTVPPVFPPASAWVIPSTLPPMPSVLPFPIPFPPPQ